MTEKKNNHTMSQMTHEHHMDHDHNMSMMSDSEMECQPCQCTTMMLRWVWQAWT